MKNTKYKDLLKQIDTLEVKVHMSSNVEDEIPCNDMTFKEVQEMLRSDLQNRCISTSTYNEVTSSLLFLGYVEFSVRNDDSQGGASRIYYELELKLEED